MATTASMKNLADKADVNISDSISSGKSVHLMSIEICIFCSWAGGRWQGMWYQQLWSCPSLAFSQIYMANPNSPLTTATVYHILFREKKKKKKKKGMGQEKNSRKF